MRQGTHSVDLQSIDENIRLLKDRIDQFDDRKVQSVFSRLLDHMGCLRETLLDLEDLLKKPTSDSDTCHPGA